MRIEVELGPGTLPGHVFDRSLGRISREHPGWVDAAVVALALTASVASLWYVATLAVLPVALLLNIVPPLALVRRRSAPVPVLVVILGIALLQWALAVTLNLAQVSTLIALYSVARYASRPAARATLVAGLLMVLIAPLRQPYTGLGNLLAAAGLVVVVHLLGTNAALRQRYLVELEGRAKRLERERDAAAEVAAARERTRIARELHDVVAHHVSVMVVQAEGAGWAIGSRPDQARAAVATIARTGRSTLVELRRLLGVLRSDASDGVLPQPGLADLCGLIQDFRSTGMKVVPDLDSDLEVKSPDVPDGLQLAAFRIVQEGLTNVLKHAGPSVEAKVIVRIDESSEVGQSDVGELTVQVQDDGLGSSSIDRDDVEKRHVGHGLIGIRERVALFEGAVTIGADANGGFSVRAVLPFRAGGS
jgi:signal transduction histidine kinase